MPSFQLLLWPLSSSSFACISSFLFNLCPVTPVFPSAQRRGSRSRPRQRLRAQDALRLLPARRLLLGLCLSAARALLRAQCAHLQCAPRGARVLWQGDARARGRRLSGFVAAARFHFDVETKIFSLQIFSDIFADGNIGTDFPMYL
jgi:hypothetical protein